MELSHPQITFFACQIETLEFQFCLVIATGLVARFESKTNDAFLFFVHFRIYYKKIKLLFKIQIWVPSSLTALNCIQRNVILVLLSQQPGSEVWPQRPSASEMRQSLLVKQKWVKVKSRRSSLVWRGADAGFICGRKYETWHDDAILSPLSYKKCRGMVKSLGCCKMRHF